MDFPRVLCIADSLGTMFSLACLSQMRKRNSRATTTTTSIRSVRLNDEFINNLRKHLLNILLLFCFGFHRMFRCGCFGPFVGRPNETGMDVV